MHLAFLHVLNTCFFFWFLGQGWEGGWGWGRQLLTSMATSGTASSEGLASRHGLQYVARAGLSALCPHTICTCTCFPWPLPDTPRRDMAKGFVVEAENARKNSGWPLLQFSLLNICVHLFEKVLKVLCSPHNLKHISGSYAQNNSVK